MRLITARIFPYAFTFFISVGTVLLLLSPSPTSATTMSLSDMISVSDSSQSTATSALMPAQNYFSSSPSVGNVGGFSYIASSSDNGGTQTLSSAPSTPYSITCSGAACTTTNLSCSLSIIFTRDLRMGTTGIDVIALQTYLIQIGYLSVPQTTVLGYFGSLTAQALASYQTSVGLSATGYLDVNSRYFLNNLILQGTACYQYMRFDLLQFTVAKNASRLDIATNFNRLGITADGTKVFCLSQASYCSDISKVTSFVGYLPKNVTAVRAAMYLSGFPKLFSAVTYVKSTPAYAMSSIVTTGGTFIFK